MNKLLIVLLVAAAIALPLFFFWSDIQTVFGNNSMEGNVVLGKDKDKDNGKKKKDKKDKDKQDEEAAASAITITEKWQLPADLQEVSGHTWLDDTRFACIQDEAGKIFIYNTADKAIEKVIPFGASGDYEGVALAGTAAYVMRADGQLFELSGYNSAKPQVKQYRTRLSAAHDVEGLCYDSGNNRLLIAAKEAVPAASTHKGIYAFSLASKTMDAEPVYKIPLDHAVFKDLGEKKLTNVFSPSDISIHPQTGELYLTEGSKPKLLILDPSGTPKQLYKLRSSDFPQPEGLSFSPAGDLFISSEGKKDPGTISKVVLRP